MAILDMWKNRNIILSVMVIIASFSCVHKPLVPRDPVLDRLCQDNLQLIYPVSKKDIPDWMLAYIKGSSLGNGCVVGVSDLKRSENSATVQAYKRAMEIKGIQVPTEITTTYNKQTSYNGSSSEVRDPHLTEKISVFSKGEGRVFPKAKIYTVTLKTHDGVSHFRSYVFVCDDLVAKQRDKIQSNPDFRQKMALEAGIKELFETFKTNFGDRLIPSLRNQREEEKEKLFVIVSSALKPKIIVKFREALSSFAVSKEQNIFLGAERCFDYTGAVEDWVLIAREHLKNRNNFLSWWNTNPKKISNYAISCFPTSDGRGVVLYLLRKDKKSGKILVERQVPNLVNQGEDVRRPVRIYVKKDKGDKSFEALVSRSEKINVGIGQETTLRIVNTKTKKELKIVSINPNSGWNRIKISRLGVEGYSCNGKWDVTVEAVDEVGIKPQRISGNAYVGANKCHLEMEGDTTYRRYFRDTLMRDCQSIVLNKCEANYRLICKLSLHKEQNEIQLDAKLFKGKTDKKGILKSFFYSMDKWSKEYVTKQLKDLSFKLIKGFINKNLKESL